MARSVSSSRGIAFVQLRKEYGMARSLAYWKMVVNDCGDASETGQVKRILYGRCLASPFEASNSDTEARAGCLDMSLT